MNPIKAAIWISKFVAMLALLLVIIPAVVFYGGVFMIAATESAYENWHRDRVAQQVSACITRWDKWIADRHDWSKGVSSNTLPTRTTVYEPTPETQQAMKDYHKACEMDAGITPQTEEKAQPIDEYTTPIPKGATFGAACDHDRAVRADGTSPACEPEHIIP